MAAVRRCCRNCSNAVFNERWGEYRCVKKERRVLAEHGMTCRDFHNGIPKRKSRMNSYLDNVYAIIKETCVGMDAVYEDYIIRTVGMAGLTELRGAKLLEPCGVVNGRQLYTLLAK